MTSPSQFPVTIDDIRDAAKLLAGQVVRTPCNPSRTLSDLTGAEVVLKFENQQFTGSFKDRGALVKLSSLTAEERRAGVVAMSAGNHAQAVACHAQKLGIPATIVMPRFTPNVKVRRTRAFGARVVLHGEGLDEARAHADEIAAREGKQIVHPYDDDRVIAGQGTVALEMFEDHPDLDVLVIPIGGGGLMSGNAIAARAIRPEIEIVGVESEQFPAMRQALAGQPVRCGVSTIAEGIAVKEPGAKTLPIIRALVDDIVLVTEDAIESAVQMLLEIEKVVVEGAGAAGLAAVLSDSARFVGRKVGVVLCGGNIDLLVLSSIIHRGLARRGRMIRMRVGMPDRPGSLADVSRIIADANASVVELHHQRAFSALSVKSVEVEFVLETLGQEHVREIVNALERGGYRAFLPDAELMIGR